MDLLQGTVTLKPCFITYMEHPLKTTLRLSLCKPNGSHLQSQKLGGRGNAQ